MHEGKCLKCGSSEVIPNVFVLDLGHGNFPNNLKVMVEETPDAWLFKGQLRSSLKAWVCGACGYTELYAKEPDAPLAAYRKHGEKS